MKSALLALVFAVGAAGVANGQTVTTAALDAAAWQPVISTCQSVAENQIVGDPGPDGLCINTTLDYLNLLKLGVDQAAFNPNDSDDAMGAFLAALAALALDDKNCRLVRTEIPQALTEAGPFFNNPDQQQSLTDIVESISSCNLTATAETELAPEASGG